MCKKIGLLQIRNNTWINIRLLKKILLCIISGEEIKIFMQVKFVNKCLQFFGMIYLSLYCLLCFEDNMITF